MKTRTNNAEVFVRQAETGDELPSWQLKRTGLILARMDRPGQLLLEVRTTCMTVVTAHIDGNEVLKTDPMLRPGRHPLTGPQLAFVPAGVSAPPVDNGEPAELDAYLESLGVEPDPVPNTQVPYIGEAGGVLKVTLGYFREDNGEFYEYEGDELTFKISSTSAFNRAVAENVHRLVIAKDPDTAAHGPLCGLNTLFDPEADHDH
jgi:hypothetical protein